MPRISSLLPAFVLSFVTGCVLYGDAEEFKSCDDVVCGNNASCGGDQAECFCDAGHAGNP